MGGNASLGLKPRLLILEALPLKLPFPLPSIYLQGVGIGENFWNLPSLVKAVPRVGDGKSHSAAALVLTPSPSSGRSAIAQPQRPAFIICQHPRGLCRLLKDARMVLGTQDFSGTPSSQGPPLSTSIPTLIQTSSGSPLLPSLLQPGWLRCEAVADQAPPPTRLVPNGQLSLRGRSLSSPTASADIWLGSPAQRLPCPLLSASGTHHPGKAQ